jgi:hypothetical protein
MEDIYKKRWEYIKEDADGMNVIEIFTKNTGWR